jgi:adenylate cyclase class 2
MKNIELKSVCTRLHLARGKCKQIKAEYKGILKQTDTYFNVKPGRLKLRNVNGRKFELIYYSRTGKGSEMESDYEIIKLNDDKEIKNIIKSAIGIKGIVKKKRELYVFENVRIHLDTMSKLGTFIEFEIVCSSPKDLKDAPRKMNYLKKIFEIKQKDLISKSYIDLILKKHK